MESDGRRYLSISAGNEEEWKNRKIQREEEEDKGERGDREIEKWKKRVTEIGVSLRLRSTIQRRQTIE